MSSLSSTAIAAGNLVFLYTTSLSGSPDFDLALQKVWTCATGLKSKPLPESLWSQKLETSEMSMLSSYLRWYRRRRSQTSTRGSQAFVCHNDMRPELDVVVVFQFYDASY